MSCPFDPASEDVADFIASYYNLDQPVIPIPDDSCSFFLTDTLGIIYMPLSEAEPITIERHTYNGIPKLYTPLDISAAEAAGFSDSELFERSFQRRTGMEARVYRKMLLGK